MPMRRLFYCFLLLLLLPESPALAQDCTLGIGGKDTEVIIQVFQLDEEQQEKVYHWSGELEAYHKTMRDQIRELFDTHPQQTMEELETLAQKYSVLKDQIEEMVKSYDRKVLAILDSRQYEQYVALCREVLRQPMPAAAVESQTVIPD